MHYSILFPKYVSTFIGTGATQMLYNSIETCKTCFNKIDICTSYFSVKLVKKVVGPHSSCTCDEKEVGNCMMFFVCYEISYEISFQCGWVNYLVCQSGI